MAGLYADSGSVGSASGGTMMANRDSIMSGIARCWENVGQNMRNPEWKWGTGYVEERGPGAAVLTASWSIPHVAPNGQPHVISGVWTAAFRRTSGGWRIVQEHLSAQ
jgi:ketosteroid isomerase-like protein